ncbi:hypothetical protein BJ165DRAFT_768058 [Panaeolus papilionaceus]|nr:hypothetical protein BJ165DRAFT_768058 [Panaeolus papilionaceus]
MVPITETRLVGSRRKTFKMLKKLFDSDMYSASLIVITTMWDTIQNERTQNRAESNFAQMRGANETLKEFVRRPSTDVIKFMNTKNSALLAIDQSLYTTAVFTDYKASKSPLLYIKTSMSTSRGLSRRNKSLRQTWPKPKAKHKPMPSSGRSSRGTRGRITRH